MLKDGLDKPSIVNKRISSFNYQRATTLIELALVIVIIGILAAVIIPRFASVSVFTQRTFFDEVTGSIRYAQKVAIGMGCDVQVNLAKTNLNLKLRQSCRSGKFSLDIRDPATGANEYVKDIPKGINLKGKKLPFYFDRLGRVHNNAGDIVDAKVSVNAQEIIIVGETGYVYKEE